MLTISDPVKINKNIDIFMLGMTYLYIYNKYISINRNNLDLGSKIYTDFPNLIKFMLYPMALNDKIPRTRYERIDIKSVCEWLQIFSKILMSDNNLNNYIQRGSRRKNFKIKRKSKNNIKFMDTKIK